MPQFLYDYHLWWLNFWVAHPLAYWGVGAIVAVVAIIGMRSH